jgi:uncharacterized membrane protein YagU involved in acid resistance
MDSYIARGAWAGLIAGILFGLMMTMISAPAIDGGRIPLMQMVAMSVGATSLVAGWIFHLFNSALIGAIFGAIFGNKLDNYAKSSALGALYGLAWWVVGGMVLMPLLLGDPAFAPIITPEMRPVAVGSLMGHVIYGAVTGAAYLGLAHNTRGRRREGKLPA